MDPGERDTSGDSPGDKSSDTQPQIGDEATLVATEVSAEDEDLGDADTDAPDSGFDMLLRQVAAAPSWKLGGDDGEIADGETIGDSYVVEGKIGHGGMGVVYRARDTKLDRDVAVKLHLQATGSTAVRRLVREARAMAQLSHPNIVSVFDVGEHRGQVFIAMEYVPGGSLRSWLAKGLRPWREVLDLFIQAGRGLAAAHAQGLVHRDFKPDNVLLDGQGRALVADFGLATLDARSVASLSPSPLDDSSASQSGASPVPAELRARTEPGSRTPLVTGQGSARSASSDEMLGGRLTATGGAVGTPAYMAPEQYAPADLTAAADQFAFSVALYEGLYGRRPYTARSTAARMTEAAMGRIRPPPEDTDVPAWLWRAVTRGLQPEPEQRFASMQAMVAVLERRGRRAWHVPAVVGFVVVGSVSGAWVLSERPDRCTGGPSLFASALDDDRRAAIDRAFRSRGTPQATAELERVEAELDEFRRRWLEMFDDTCRATLVDDRQSAEVYDRRMACLRGRLDALAGASEVLATADERVVSQASELVDSLPQVEDCADSERLEEDYPLPADPDLQRRIGEVRRALAQMNAEMDVGRTVVARPMLDRIVEQSTGLDWAPLQIELAAARARVLKNEDRREEAAAAYEQALWLAVELGRRSYVARASLQLGSMLALELGRPEDAGPILRLAQANAQYSSDPAYEAKLEHTRGSIAFLEADYERAEVHYRRQRQLAAALDDGGPETIIALTNLAKVADSQGHFEIGYRHHQEALRRQRELPGDDAYGLARIHIGLAVHFMMQRRLSDALPEYERALALVEAYAGPESLATAELLIDVGRTYAYAERLEDARRVQERALRILEREGAVHDERYALLLVSQVELDLNAGGCEGHLDALDRVLSFAEGRVWSWSIVERAHAAKVHCLVGEGRIDDAVGCAYEFVANPHPERPQSMAAAYEALADVLLTAERYEEALASAEAGLLILGAMSLAQEAIGSKLHVLRGEALFRLDRMPEAIEAARRALLPMEPGEPRTLVREFRLGQFLAAAGDVDEARMWFAKTEPELAADPVEYAERLEWLRDWRRKHP